MAEPTLALLVIVIAIAITFDFFNGIHDAGNAIATVVSTRVLSPLVAVLMAAGMNFLGALSGTAVAKVVGAGIVSPEGITLLTVAAGVSAAILWEFITLRLGIPVSGSHALVSGVAGAGVATGGLHVLIAHGINKVLLGLALAPVIGFVVGYILMLAMYWIFRKASPGLISGIFGKLQIVSAAAMAYSHGSNDAQKTMGIITLALAVYYNWAERGIAFEVPFAVIILSAVVMAVGTYFGGWRIVRTLGVRIVQMRPIQGFAAESSAAAVIESASRFGFPLSTTHVISSTIMGQGATVRFSAVRWGVARRIAAAWLFTFPFCGFLGWLLMKVLDIAL